ncbi:hypothetical protein ACSSS7_003311 [Eimeria intestinalis]
MSGVLTSTRSLPAASSQGGLGLDPRRTVRFSEDPGGVAVLPPKQSQLIRSPPAAASPARSVGASVSSGVPAASVAGRQVPAASVVLRLQPAKDVTSSPEPPRGPQDDLSRSTCMGLPGLPGLPKGASGVMGKSCLTSGPRPSSSFEAADSQQQQQKQQQQRGRRVLEIEGTPSSLLRIADASQVEASNLSKIANVAFIPPTRSRSGSCPVFSRFCSRPASSQQFTLFGNIPGFQRQQTQQSKSSKKQQQQSPSFPSMCCFVPRSSRSSMSAAGGDVQGLYEEVLRLREQNAALLKERDELIMENDAQRRELETLAREKAEEASAAAFCKAEIPVEHLEQLQALEEENAALRQQLGDLGTALCTTGPAKDSSTVNALLASQLRTAHADITKLRSIVRNQLRAAGFAQDGIGQAMKTIGKGGEVFASDPNDITVQEAALDSLLARGRRRVLAAREFVWSAVATLKDLVDQTFERMSRLVKSEVSVRQKVAYVHELHGLVTSQLDPALKAYNDLDGIHKELENLKAVVFDPKRNNPYCPCRPRRMVLEDDLEHVQKQLRETNEALRNARTQLVKLEMENLANYVQDKCANPNGVSPLVVGNPRSGAPPAGNAEGARKVEKGAAPPGAPTQEEGEDLREEESMEALLRRAQREHEAAKVEQAIAALKDEVEMLKDRAMLEEVQRAQPPGYLAEELFSQGAVFARLINQVVQSTGQLAERLAHKEVAAPARQRLLSSVNNLQQVARDTHAGALPLEAVVQRAATVLNSLHLEEISSNLDPEDRRLLQMIEEQAVKVRRINMGLQQVAASPGTFMDVR